MAPVKYQERQDITDVSLNGDTAEVDIWYPRNGRPKYLEVGLMDVRAADSIRISYDFDRDGWCIEQAAIFAWAADDKTCDPEWREVAFVGAWAREKSPGPD